MVAQDEVQVEEQTTNTFKDNRAPKCARCRNHGVVNSLKGHKHFCQWKNCTCPRCQVVVERQRITASRVASLRQQRKQNDSVQKRVGNILKFHDSMSPDSRNLINLDNVKYLRQMKQYSLDSDNDSERADSSGTPASLSPPSSPPSSIASGDFDNTKQKPTNTSYCTDPSCYECWKISQYMLKTKINKLKSMFPMLPTRTLELALAKNRGDIPAATQQLLVTIQKPVSYRDVRPCTDPECKECEFGRDSIPIRRSPITFPMLSRKRGYEYQPRYGYDPLAKRPFTTDDYKYSRRSPVAEMERKLVSPVALSEGEKSPSKSRIMSPPTLIKYCVDCNSQISIDDKFCGKCGFKQAVKTEKEE